MRKVFCFTPYKNTIYFFLKKKKHHGCMHWEANALLEDGGVAQDKRLHLQTKDIFPNKKFIACSRMLQAIKLNTQETKFNHFHDNFI